MTDLEDVDERLRAVERALTDTDRDLAALETNAALAERVDALEERLADLTGRVDELDASTQAVRGYVGNVRSVERDVERRAEAALAAVEDLEARLDTCDAFDGCETGTEDGDAGATSADSHPEPGETAEAADRAADARPRDASPERIARHVAGESDAPTAGTGRLEGNCDSGERPRTDPRSRTRDDRGRPQPRGDEDGDDGLLADIRDAL